MEITDQNFESEVIKSDLPVFTYFSADWCGPCKMAGPAIDELADEYSAKIKIVKINVDQNPQSPQKYNVMSIPTVIIFKDGQEVKREIGFSGKEGYKKLIDDVLGSS